MHLQEIIDNRGVQGFGVYLCITRRCPLDCAHCCTNSLDSSREELPADAILQFVAGYGDSSPSLQLITGGEALMRPELVSALAITARNNGTRSYLLSGGFFAKEHGSLQPAIRKAIASVNHFSLSVDKFHDARVSRAAQIHVLKQAIDLGVQVSVQTVAAKPFDSYVTILNEDITKALGARVPILALPLKKMGRGSSLIDDEVYSNSFPSNTIVPCRAAGWPVVSFSGHIVACCNQSVVDGPVPSHLSMGSIFDSTWHDVLSRMEASNLLRDIRTIGPKACAVRTGLKGSHDGLCATCKSLKGSKRSISLGKIDVKFDLLSDFVSDVNQSRGLAASGFEHLLATGFTR